MMAPFGIASFPWYFCKPTGHDPALFQFLFGVNISAGGSNRSPTTANEKGPPNWQPFPEISQ